MVKAHHDDPNGPYYDIIVIPSKSIEKIPSKPIEKRDVNTVHNKLVRMMDVPPHRADSATVYKGDLIWYKPSDNPNWIGAQVTQGTVKIAHPDGSFSILVPQNGGIATLTTDISHLILRQTWPQFRKDQRLIYCPDRKNPSAWTYAVSKDVKLVGSNQYLYAIEIGGSHQCTVWESKLEKTGKNPPLYPDVSSFCSSAVSSPMPSGMPVQN